MSTTEDAQAHATEPDGDLAAALARESQLRAALVDAHRKRLESEDAAAALSAQLGQARQQALADRVRRERLEQALPVRALRKLTGLAVMRPVRSLRTRGYDRALARARGEDD